MATTDLAEKFRIILGFGLRQFSPLKTAPKTEPDFDNPKCLCGIPGCEGHEDLGGYIVIPKLVADLLFEREES